LITSDDSESDMSHPKVAENYSNAGMDDGIVDAELGNGNAEGDMLVVPEKESGRGRGRGRGRGSGSGRGRGRGRGRGGRRGSDIEKGEIEKTVSGDYGLAAKTTEGTAAGTIADPESNSPSLSNDQHHENAPSTDSNGAKVKKRGRPRGSINKGQGE
jgi:hypothetical protein